MPSHQPLSVAARTLQTSETILLEFGRKSWIQVVERQGVAYVDAHQQYKARYILHLRNRRHLSDEQITFVLSEQRPPYSVKEVDQLLARYEKAVREPVPNGA
jgi:hypothetical protein